MYVYVNILLIRKKETLLVRILIIHNLIHYLFCLLHIFACLNTVYNKHEILPILIITFSLILMTSQVGQTTLMYLNVSWSKSVAIWRVICRGPREVTSPLHVTWLRARDVVILDVGYWMIYGTRRYPGIVSVIEVRSYQKDGFKTVYGYTFKSKFCERARESIDISLFLWIHFKAITYKHLHCSIHCANQSLKAVNTPCPKCCLHCEGETELRCSYRIHNYCNQCQIQKINKKKICQLEEFIEKMRK